MSSSVQLSRHVADYYKQACRRLDADTVAYAKARRLANSYAWMADDQVRGANGTLSRRVVIGVGA